MAYRKHLHLCMRKLLAILSFSLLGYGLMSQVYGVQTHAPFLQLMNNPACAGMNQEMEVLAWYRNQWTNLSGATISHPAFAIGVPILKIRSGLSFQFHYDMIGAARNAHVNLGYAYQIQFRKWQIGLGVSGGIVQASILGALLRAPEGDYAGGVINHNDPLIPVSTENGIAPLLGAGFFIKRQGFRLGCNGLSLLSGKASANVDNTIKNIIFRRQIQAFAAYEFAIGKKYFLEPAVQYRTDLVQHQMEFLLNWSYKRRIRLGAGYRGYNNLSNSGVLLQIGSQIVDRLEIGYSYDISIGGLRGANGGSHEVMIRWTRPFKKKEVNLKTIYNPRFL